MKRTVLMAIGVAVCVALAAVASTKRAMPGLAFSGVEVPRTLADKTRTIGSTSARWQGRSFPLNFEAFAHSGDMFDGVAFGQLLDIDGVVVHREDGSPHICSSLDGASLLQARGALWSIAHGECQPGVL